MEVVSLAPKFLISDNIFDPAIKTACVLVIKTANNQIWFLLKNNTKECWTFGSREIAEVEYKKIKQELNKCVIT